MMSSSTARVWFLNPLLFFSAFFWVLWIIIAVTVTLVGLGRKWNSAEWHSAVLWCCGFFFSGVSTRKVGTDFDKGATKKKEMLGNLTLFKHRVQFRRRNNDLGKFWVKFNIGFEGSRSFKVFKLTVNNQKGNESVNLNWMMKLNAENCSNLKFWTGNV